MQPTHERYHVEPTDIWLVVNGLGVSNEKIALLALVFAPKVLSQIIYHANIRLPAQTSMRSVARRRFFRLRLRKDTIALIIGLDRHGKTDPAHLSTFGRFVYSLLITFAGTKVLK